MRARSLTPDQVRRSMTLSVVEGACYAVMVGLSEHYFIADAVRLGASMLLLGLITGLALAVGGLAAVLGVSLMRRLRRRKPLVIALVLVQTAILAGLALAERADLMTPARLLATVCAYHACGQFANTLWSSWYGDLVPPAIRGRYFSRRSRIVHATTFASLVLGGLLLQHLEPHGSPRAGELGGGGFALLYALSAAARVTCCVLLVRSPEPEFHHETRATVLSHLRSADGPTALRLLGMVGLLQFAVYIGSPYFSPFMLRDMQLSYGAFMLAAASQVAVKVLSLRAFGAAVDAHGGTAVYRLAALLVALIPLPWLFLDNLASAMIVQSFSGFAWAAHEISLLALLLGHSAPRTRPAVFAMQSLLNGSAQLLGSAAGAVLFDAFDQSHRAVFAVSFGARLAVAMAVPLLMMDLGPERRIGHGRLLLRVIGVRPSGGINHRPMLESEESEE